MREVLHDIYIIKKGVQYINLIFRAARYLSVGPHQKPSNTRNSHQHQTVGLMVFFYGKSCRMESDLTGIGEIIQFLKG